MGYSEEILTNQFTQDNVLDRELVIRMLCREEEIVRSDDGQNRYRNPENKPYHSLNTYYTINRIVLAEFGFNPSTDSVESYRNIFKTYYRSSTDYDKEVLDSVHYMRNNRCVYYTSPVIHVGNELPNSNLLCIDGQTPTTLHDIIDQYMPFSFFIVAAFSLS
jgi:hypothetical protein